MLDDVIDPEASEIVDDEATEGESEEEVEEDFEQMYKIAGQIKTMRLVNFMCHKNFMVDFNAHINFITGQNGSKLRAFLL